MLFAISEFSDCGGLIPSEFGVLFDVRINGQAAMIDNMNDLMVYGSGGPYHLSVPETENDAKIVITFTSAVDFVGVTLEADNLDESRSFVRALDINSNRIFRENLVI